MDAQVSPVLAAIMIVTCLAIAMFEEDMSCAGWPGTGYGGHDGEEQEDAKRQLMAIAVDGTGVVKATTTPADTLPGSFRTHRSLRA
jgi:hypothetical protein